MFMFPLKNFARKGLRMNQNNQLHNSAKQLHNLQIYFLKKMKCKGLMNKTPQLPVP